MIVGRCGEWRLKTIKMHFKALFVLGVLSFVNCDAGVLFEKEETEKLRDFSQQRAFS